jgi:FdhD protein
MQSLGIIMPSSKILNKRMRKNDQPHYNIHEISHIPVCALRNNPYIEVMENVGTLDAFVKKWSRGILQETTDTLAEEEPLEITLAYWEKGQTIKRNISVTMRTPGHDAELAAGFLFTEGIIGLEHHVASIAHLGPNKLLVQLQGETRPRLQGAERNFYTTSSCGVCGKTSIDAVKTVSRFSAKVDDLCLPGNVLCRLPAMVKEKQELFRVTGGIHAATLFDLRGNLLALREDVGRHNALDKLIGFAIAESWLPLQEHILLLSGRASFELVQKAAMAGIKIIAAIGAPSSLAVSLAKDHKMTLVGFLRGDAFNIYAGSQRIHSETKQSVVL